MPHTRLAPELLRSIVNTVDEIIYALDLSENDSLTAARVSFVSNRIRDVLGYEPTDFLADGSFWFNLVHPEDRSSVHDSSQQILASRQPGRRYYRMRHKTLDTYVWLEDSLVPQFTADGLLIGMVGAARDVTARKRVAHQMAVLLENSRDGFFTLDQGGRCVDANPAGSRLFGRPAADMVGRIFHELLNEPERSAFAKNHGRAVREGTVVRASGYCNSLDRWLETAIFPSPDGAMVHFRDVTTQRASEERLRTWVDDAPVALFRTVPDGKVLDANGTALAMLGYPNLDTLREKNGLDLVVQGGAGDAPRLDFGAFERITGLPITLKRMDGSDMPVLMNLHAVRDHSGNPVEILGSFEDRSEPASLRSALLSSARRYRIVFDENVTPMIVIALDGTILAQNQAFVRLAGLSNLRGPDDDQPTGALIDYMVRPEAATDLIARARGSRVEGIELMLRRADGTTRRVLASARLASDTPDAAFIETSFVDIEDRSRVEDQLRRTLQEREFLMRELHHRVKNNLQLISSILSLQAREATDPNLHDFARKTRDRIMAMAVVHERLYQTDEVGSACVLGYLEALVRNLADSHDADTRGIRLEVDGACVQMTLDQTMRCGLMVNELVMNALKHAFGPRGGTIRVNVAQDESDASCVTVSVSDTGSGLPRDFDPAQSSGLGVQMVENLARQSGGSVRWTSGGGTTVSFDFRLAPLAEQMAVVH